MTKTVLITGASTGIGYATALLFEQRGWNVVATMRSPEKVSALKNAVYLDVTKPDSIESAIATTVQKFQSIDVLVNNAGYSLLGAFEACTLAQIEQQFATNVFGLMAVTRAVLPYFRQQRSGTIINIASIGGRMAFPLYSLYHSTKWAVEGFSDALQYELEPFNIRVKLIEPGPIKTDFYGRSTDLAAADLTDYEPFISKIIPTLKKAGEAGSPPEKVAEVIYQAAIDRSSRLRYPAGGNANVLLLLRKLLPDAVFSKIVRTSLIR